MECWPRLLEQKIKLVLNDNNGKKVNITTADQRLLEQNLVILTPVHPVLP